MIAETMGTTTYLDGSLVDSV